jgi:hypothetical protein
MTSNGVGHTSIVLGGRATEVEQFAAQELAKYLKAISDVEIPLLVDCGDGSPWTILVGTPESNEAISRLQIEGRLEPLTEHLLGFDGYVVKTICQGKQTVLVLGSHHPRGVLFAVYDFLEANLGVRFFGFRDAGELIPKQPTIKVCSIDRRQKPGFRFRISNNNNFHSTNRAMLTKVADWSAKNRLNAFLLPLDNLEHIATEELTKRGLEIWGGGHVWAHFTPEKSAFDSNPEYFPLINGKRIFPGDKVAISFCYSNPEAMRSFVAKACNYARQRPMMSVFACWAEDGSQGWAQCRCGGCKQYTFRDWNLFIVNQLAKAFETDPVLQHMRIQWIAYSETSVPPEKVIPYKNGKNIDLLYANGARDFLSPMDSEANRECAPWLVNDTLRKQVNTDYKENPTDDDLAAYQRLQAMLSYLKKADFQGNVSLLEYVNYHVGHWLDLPYLQHVQTGPWPEEIFPKDMKFYQSQGIVGWSDCFDWPNDRPDSFWNRLMAQILWNPCASVLEIKKDFYANYYGGAGSELQTYFKKVWEVLYQEKYAPKDYQRLRALRVHLLKAQKIVADDPLCAERVSLALDWHQSLRLAKTSSNLVEDGSFESINLSEGEERLVGGLSFQESFGAWKILRPSKLTNPQPTDGHNYILASGTNCGFRSISSHVFEANTWYKLEVDVFPSNRKGVLGISMESRGVRNGSGVMIQQQLMGLRTNEWNRLKIEWFCQPGALEEGKPIVIFCRGVEGVALDKLLLKASVGKAGSTLKQP